MHANTICEVASQASTGNVVTLAAALDLSENKYAKCVSSFNLKRL